MSLEIFPDLLLNISDVDMQSGEVQCYRFKSFTLKPAERQLFDRDTQVALSPKAFDMLTLLVVNAGHLVTKEELLEKIWAESFVEEANLARIVHTIRKALGEDENGNKFIETVPTKGYRFVPEVEKIIATPRENKEIFIANGSEELWLDRLESLSPAYAPGVLIPTDNKKLVSQWLFAGFSFVAVVVLVATLALWRRNKNETAPPGQRPISIAVLPFRPVGTGEYDHSYNVAFANSVIADLDRSKSLTVRPFTPGDYTGLTQDPVAAGKERATDYVVDADYVANNGRLQVTAHVINVSTQAVEWTIEYRSSDTDLYAAGPKVAAKIARELLAKLNLPAVATGNQGTENEEAWQSYYQGMILSNKRTVPDAEKGIEEFNNAIMLDPNFAMAYMGLAHAIQTKLTNGGDPKTLCDPAREAESKALEIDPDSGDAMVMLATNRMLCTWEIDKAEEEYRKAVELSPNSAHVRRFYAVNIVNEKRFDEALEHLRIARELEPNNPFNERLIGRALFFARRWDDAIEQSAKVYEVDPEAEQTSFVYMSYEMKGDLENAFKWFLIVKSLDHDSEDELNAWRQTYAESGWPGVLHRRLERALDDEKTEKDINRHARLLEEITTLSVQLGQYDQAFKYMSKAADSYVLFAGQMPVNPYLDPVRSDPRYKAIMAKTWNSHGGNWQ
jgi:DNA-binding winged helix-turn-helix (wHTH) protein/tetratricopeptide (TPR) repeat protein